VDITTFNKAKQAYEAKDWETAVVLFSACGTGEGTGEACHLCGNALLRLGRPQEAAQAYRAAASDPTYRNQGAVYTNLGKAQMALGDLRGAVESLRFALSDASYPGAYKSYIALGEAYSKLGDARNAGVAFRKAAFEPNNPDPTGALVNLGVCFMKMRRPADAVDVYLSALDVSVSDDERSMIYANLGQAYVALNRMGEAVGAFEAAQTGDRKLSPSANADYERALAATRGLGGFAPAYGGPDPLDPTGASGEILPPPDASGFFSIPESEIEQADRAGRGRHRGLKVALVVAALLVVACGALFFAATRGFGYPSQETAVMGAFRAAADGTDAATYWSASVAPAARIEAMDAVESGDSFAIVGLDADLTSSLAVVQATLPQGGTLTYRVSLAREGLGWKVTDVEQVVPSLVDDTFADALTEVSPAVDATADEWSDEAAGEGEGAWAEGEWTEDGAAEDGAWVEGEAAAA
jgi:tetratricopeptide (TPR) repeat protein